MRHSPFAIGPAQQQAWSRHMSEAVRASSAQPSDASELLAYFESASKMLINRSE